MNTIQTIEVSPHEVADIIESMTKATLAYSINSTIMGCLGMALALASPSISKDELIDGIKDLSERLSLLVSNNTQTLTVN